MIKRTDQNNGQQTEARLESSDSSRQASHIVAHVLLGIDDVKHGRFVDASILDIGDDH